MCQLSFGLLCIFLFGHWKFTGLGMDFLTLGSLSPSPLWRFILLSLAVNTLFGLSFAASIHELSLGLTDMGYFGL
jgi:hypothetical protein